MVVRGPIEEGLTLQYVTKNIIGTPIFTSILCFWTFKIQIALLHVRRFQKQPKLVQFPSHSFKAEKEGVDKIELANRSKNASNFSVDIA